MRYLTTFEHLALPTGYFVWEYDLYKQLLISCLKSSNWTRLDKFTMKVLYSFYLWTEEILQAMFLLISKCQPSSLLLQQRWSCRYLSLLSWQYGLNQRCMKFILQVPWQCQPGVMTVKLIVAMLFSESRERQGGMLIAHSLWDSLRTIVGTQPKRKNPHCQGAQFACIYQIPESWLVEKQHFCHPAKIDAGRIKTAWIIGKGLNNINLGLIIPVVYGNMDLFLQALLEASIFSWQAVALCFKHEYPNLTIYSCYTIYFPNLTLRYLPREIL